MSSIPHAPESLPPFVAFHPPIHLPPPVPLNTCRDRSVIHPQALKPNEDIGDSLQVLLNGADDGKNYTRVDVPQDAHPTEVWRAHVIRLYFQNVNGLRVSENGLDITSAFYHMDNIRADVFGFAETKLDCQSQHVRSLLRRSKTKIWPHACISTSSSNIPWHSCTKPGGVLLGVTGPLVGRVKQTIDDDLGRWTGIELLGRDGHQLLILCAYQVCQSSGRSGDTTAYSQQYSILRRRGSDSPNPRRQFVQDLKALLTPYTEAHADIILMGDFNETIGIASHGMAQVIADCELTDVQAFRHGMDVEQSTYARGPNRVDYFLVSSRLLPHVVRQGCEPFNVRIFSDHRGLFLDMSYPGFFDRAPNTLAPPSRRNLIYDCPRHVRNYLRYLDKYMKDHNLVDRAIRLSTDNRDDAFAEAFDRDFTKGLLAADNSCRNFQRSPWSRTLHDAMTEKYIYLRQLSALRTGRDMSGPISILQAKLPSAVLLPTSIPDAKQILRQTQKHCRAVVRRAFDLAKEHQETRIVAKQLANPSSDPESMAKIIRNRDAIRRMWRRIPSSKTKSSGGISMIKVPLDPHADPKHPDTVFRSVVDPVEMESLLLSRNRKHFRQADSNPLAAPTISARLGWSGCSPIANDLLDGSCDVASLTSDKYAQDIFSNCRRLNPEQSASITLEEFQQAYLHWNVGTSTSPSGRHLSHLHALFQPIGTLEDSAEVTSQFQDTKDNLWIAHHACVQYSTRFGHCFDRWRQIVNAMIEKEPGNPALHRLRVIHLYENDYNLILGSKFRAVLQSCQDKGQLNPGCYGGLATKQSLDPVFLEMMQYDYAALTRWDAIKFANDAGSCYDRIIVSPSNVIARSRGLNHNIARLHGNMLEHATYRIKTQLGVSTAGYSHCEDSPVFGTGQGSCSSPLIWALNGSLYFDVFDKYCHGATYSDMDGQLSLRIGMAGYVDDNSVQVNCHPRNRASLIFHATEDAQLWSDILWSSGGVLEHDKCSYHYLRTDFDSNGAPVFRSGAHGPPIVIRDSSGAPTTLTQLSAYTPYKTLGTYQCPGSSQRKQTDVLISKARSLTRLLATSACHGHPAWMFYTSVFCKSVGYPLAVSRLSPRQLLQIQGPMIPVILNRLGYERRLSHALAFGPRAYGGLGITHLKTAKYTAQISLLIRHLRTPGQPGKLTRINLNRLQHTAGVSFPIFERPSARLPHLEGSWLTHFRSSLVDINASLQIADIRIFPKQRLSDMYLMDLATMEPSLSDKEIRMINYCRLYFQCLTLSDICTAEGTALAAGISDGNRSRHQSISSLQEPFQDNPGPSAWRAWRKLLRFLCDRKGKLYQPLGAWLFRPTALRRHWPFLYSPSTRKAFKWRTRGYTELSPLRTRIYSFSGRGFTTDLPADSTPIDVEVLESGFRVLGHTPYLESPIETIPLSSLTFSEYLSGQEDHERCALLRFDTFGRDIHDVVDDMWNLDDILLVSDGGADKKCGSFGWVLGHSDGRRIACGSGTTFGYDPMSYRAEASGCRAGLLFVCHAHAYCERAFPNGTLRMFCDNSGVVEKIASLRAFPLAPVAHCLDAEWDLFISVLDLLSLFPTPPVLHHVGGHQDRHTSIDCLDLTARMNVEADSLATRELSEYLMIHPQVPFDPICCVLFHINGRTITREIESGIRDQLFLAPLREYFCKRFQWSSATWQTIDWDAYSKSYSSYPRSRKFFSQFGWKKLPCGGRLHSREARFDDRCPSCLQPDESDDHLFQCLHTDRQQWRAAFLRGITDHLTAFLDPELIDMIRLGLQGYFRDNFTALHSRFPDPRPSTVGADSDCQSTSDVYILLRQAQDAIGWDHFLRGKMSMDWSRLQYKYAARHNFLKESKNWQHWLLTYMTSQSYTLWCARNRKRHGSDGRSQRRTQLDQTKRDVSALYELKDMVLPRDRDLFSASLEIHLLQPLDHLRNWLSINKELIQSSARTASAQMRAKTKDIHTYFPTLGRRSAPVPRHRRVFHPIRAAATRLTRFFPLRHRRPTSSGARLPSTLPNASPLVSRPRQRYLFDFFPNHPG